MTVGFTVSKTQNRLYPRKFDWEEARHRHFVYGETFKTIAGRFGVSPTAVKRVCDEYTFARMRETLDAWQKTGACVDCGTSCTRRSNPRNGESLCDDCDARRRATSVRETELQCIACREWKPDGFFSTDRNNFWRRHRQHACRACSTKLKRTYREKNTEPCSHGCGRMVRTVNRRDPKKPLECQPCSLERINAEKRVAA